MYYRYFSNSPQRPAHFGVRTHAQKLIYYDGLDDLAENDRWEFYDLAADPAETPNVVEDPAQASVIRRLKKRLATLRSELGDRP